MSVPVTALSERSPSLSAEDIVASLVPPQQFASASFDSYIPDDEYPSQAHARDVLAAFATASTAATSGKLFGRRQKTEEARPGVYLDGARLVMYANISKEGWRERRAVIRGWRRLIATAANRGLPIHAIADKKLATSAKLLEHFGFRHLVDDTYEWEPRRV